MFKDKFPMMALGHLHEFIPSFIPQLVIMFLLYSISGCLAFGGEQKKDPTLLELACQWKPQAINKYRIDI